MIRKFINFFKRVNISKNCIKYGITNYTINDDLSIDVHGDVDISRFRIDKIPLKFNRVNGRFNFGYTNVTSLKGCPNVVFTNSKIQSFEGCPRVINVYISCAGNYIKSFKGIPEDFNGALNCHGNPIDNIYQLFKYNNRCIYWLNEYEVIRGNDVIMML